MLEGVTVGVAGADGVNDDEGVVEGVWEVVAVLEGVPVGEADIVRELVKLGSTVIEAVLVGVSEGVPEGEAPVEMEAEGEAEFEGELELDDVVLGGMNDEVTDMVGRGVGKPPTGAGTTPLKRMFALVVKATKVFVLATVS